MTESEAIQQITDDLRTCGVCPGGVVLVHSSLSSLGRVPGGPETVVRGLLRAIEPDGTLLMPALSYRTVNAACPQFDVRRTTSCVGAIAEHFRTREGVIRSVHPTHSVCAAGPMAHAMVCRHYLDTTPVGPHSPFRQLRDVGGQIVMLGCGMGPNTSMHGVEELVGPTYLFEGASVYRLTHADGNVTEMQCRRHGFLGLRQRYDRLISLMDEGLQTGAVLSATAHVLQASLMWSRAEKQLRREPMFFVEPV